MEMKLPFMMRQFNPNSMKDMVDMMFRALMMQKKRIETLENYIKKIEVQNDKELRAIKANPKRQMKLKKCKRKITAHKAEVCRCGSNVCCVKFPQYCKKLTLEEMVARGYIKVEELRQIIKFHEKTGM